MRIAIFSVFSDELKQLRTYLNNLNLPISNIIAISIDYKEPLNASLHININTNGNTNAPFNYFLLGMILKILYEMENFDVIISTSIPENIDALSVFSQLLGVDMISNAVTINYDKNSGKIVTTKYILAGKAKLTSMFTEKKPYIILIAPGYLKSSGSETYINDNKYIDINIEELIKMIRDKFNKYYELLGQIETLSIKEKPKGGIRIEDAELIVSVGRGFKKQDDLKLAFELAEVLGAEIGCSRPIAADLKWLGEDHWVGLSGHKVRPKLYIAIGISGQPQHLAGMMESKTVVVINNDPNAPFFKNCDYGIIGDLYIVVPKIIEELKKAKKLKISG
jgi:electron transfer flavoprotein alpha subunit